MRRLFWATLGIGFGAAAGVGVMRWAGRARQAVHPRSLLDQAADWGERLADLVDQGREAMIERERELRATLGVDGQAGDGHRPPAAP